MAVQTLSPAPFAPATTARLRQQVHAIRWTPAPRFEGGIAGRARYLGYLAGSMLAWTAAGLGVSALLGALVRLGG